MERAWAAAYAAAMALDPPTQTGVDDVHAHPRHVGHRWFDLIIALTAIFISGLSLYVAIGHEQIERQLVEENAKLVEGNAQLVEANSWPFLQVNGVYNSQEDGSSTVSIDNAGIGPAKLEFFQVLFDGKVEPDIQSLLRDCCGLPADAAAIRAMVPDGIMTASTAGSVLRPGEKMMFIRVDATPKQSALAGAFRRASARISFRVCYCSVFDNCWAGNLRGLKPKPVPACPAEGHSFNDAMDVGTS